MFHLLLNVIVLYESSIIEKQRGSFFYVKAHVLMITISALVALMIDYYLVKLLRQGSLVQSIQNRFIIGYSPAVFGCVLILSQRWSIFTKSMHTSDQSYWSDVLNRRGAEIFETLSGIPLVVMLCAQLLLDNTSFIHHMTGIAVGFLLYVGAFDWLTQYWFFSSMVWIGLAICFTISRIPVHDIPWILRFVKFSFKYERGRLIRVLVKDASIDIEYQIDIPHFTSSRSRRSSIIATNVQKDLDALLETNRSGRRRRRSIDSSDSDFEAMELV